MAGMAIPPAIVRVIGTIDTLIEKIAQAQALLETFADSDVDGPKIQPTLKTLPARVEAAKAAIQALLNTNPVEIPAEISTVSMAAEVTKAVAEAEIVAKSDPINVATTLSPTALLKKLAIAQVAAQDYAKAHPISFAVDVPIIELIEDVAAARADHLEVITEITGKLIPGNLVAEHIAAQAWLDAHPLDERLVASGGVASSIASSVLAGIASGISDAKNGDHGFWTGIFGSSFGNFIGSTIGSVSGTISGALTGLFSNIFGDALKTGAEASESTFSSMLQTALGAAGTIGSSAAGFGAESLVISPLIATFLTLVGAVVGGVFLLVGALGTLAVGLGTSAAGLGQAIGDVTKAWTIYNTPTLSPAEKAKKLTAALSTMPAAIQGANGPMVNFLKTLGTFAKTFDQLTGPAEARAISFLTQVVGIAKKFLTAIDIGTEAEKSVSELQNALQPFFRWLLTTGVKLYKDIESTALTLAPTGIKTVTSALELLAEVVNDMGPALINFAGYFAKEFTKLATTTQGKVQRFIKTAMSDFNSVFNWIKSLVDLFMAISPEFAGLGKAMFNTWTDIIKTFTRWVKQTKALFATFFTAHKQLINTGILGIVRALAPLVEDVIRAFMQLAIVLRPMSTQVLEAAAGLIQGLAGLIHALQTASMGTFKTLEKIFTTGPKELLHGITTMFDSLWGSIERAIPGPLQHFLGINPGNISTGVGTGTGTRHVTVGQGPTTTTPHAKYFLTDIMGHTHAFKTLASFEKFLGISGVTGKKLMTWLGGNIATSGDTLAQIRAAVEAHFKGITSSIKPAAKKTGETVGKTISSGISTSLAAGAKTNIQALATAISNTKKAVTAITKVVATQLATDLSKHGTIVAEDFMEHMAATFTGKKSSSSLITAAGTLGGDIYSNTLRRLNPTGLGHQFDTELSKSITKSGTLVITSARQLGAKAAAAFNAAVQSNVTGSASFTPSKNNPSRRP